MTAVDLSSAAREVGGSPRLRGYLAVPDGEGPWPGVVVLHELFGIDGFMRRTTDRLAREGYLALAVDIFSEGGMVRCLASTMRQMIKGEGRAFADIEAGRRYLVASPRCTGRTGVIGFCLGGGFALLTAGDFDAAAVNYGQLPRTDLDAALGGACPIVASYGGSDPSLRGAAAKLEASLTRAGVVHDVKEYPGATHAFMTDHFPRPVRVLRVLVRPDAEATADAWRRIDAFLATHLR